MLLAQYCLFTATDQLILMVQRRISDLWRHAAAEVPDTVNWADLYRTGLSAEGSVPDAELRARLEAVVCMLARTSRLLRYR